MAYDTRMKKEAYSVYTALRCMIASGISPACDVLMAIGSGGGSGYTPYLVTWHPGGGILIPYIISATPGGYAYFRNFDYARAEGFGPPSGYPYNTFLLWVDTWEYYPEWYSAWPHVYSADGDWWCIYSDIYPPGE